MPRWGMVIDLDKCTGCQTCTAACDMENNTTNMFPGEMKGRTISWQEVLHVFEGEYPEVRSEIIPMPCMQCDNPSCVRVCPTAATYKDSSMGNIVRQDYERCIGCRLCVVACPYSRRYFNWKSPEYPDTLSMHLNPDVKIRPKGVVEKCLYCEHRLARATKLAASEGRQVKTGDWVPACVQACPARARYFGDLDDPQSEVYKLSYSPRAFRLLDEMGTHPKTIYLKQGESR